MGLLNPVTGDIFGSKAQTLVNAVNCFGVMGKRIALTFKNRFPDMYKDYVDKCRGGEVKLGQPYLFRGSKEPWVLNFPTKSHWKEASKLQDIVGGMEYLKGHYKDWGISSLAVPALGCGEGGLKWKVVERTLNQYLNDFDIPVELYAP